jgi:hypothetical protein
MVNIKDFSSVPSADKLITIFERQKELMVKYHQIELANGVYSPTETLNLDMMKDQLRLKDFAWRITEELGEALEALLLHPGTEHMEEEISDSLHFLTEFSIMVNYRPEGTLEEFYNIANQTHQLGATAFKQKNFASMAYRVGYFTMRLAIVCNTLKNKPWKQTQMITDKTYFFESLRLTWIAFMQLCSVAGITPDKLYDLYFRKMQVNLFRQESKY